MSADFAHKVVTNFSKKKCKADLTQIRISFGQVRFLKKLRTDIQGGQHDNIWQRSLNNFQSETACMSFIFCEKLEQPCKMSAIINSQHVKV